MQRLLRETVADVFPGVGAEDDRVLWHQRDAPAQLVRIDLADIDTIETNLAGVRIVEAQQQLQHR